MFTQFFEELNISTHGNKLIKITNKIINFVNNSKVKYGILNISILHTSASLIIQENADDDVQKDLINFYDKLVPMNDKLYIHNTEGKDDMPAHIKSSLTNSNITLSIKNNQLVLGTWQGLYLFEHRIDRQTRKIFLHIIGEK